MWTTPQALELSHREPQFDLYALFAGMAAISAMLLPGISGILLNVLGMYAPALGALADLSSGLIKGVIDRDAFFLLLSLGLGILAGAALFSHAIFWLLKHRHLFTLSLLTGFMLGALRSVWPFWKMGWRINPLSPDKGLELVLLKPELPDFFTVDFFISALFLLGGLASSPDRIPGG